ncbi:MAG: hypothetical protein V5A30_11400 [Haloarculaceae archaeon]
MASLLVTVALLVLGLALAVGGFLFFTEALYGLGLLAGLSVGLVVLTAEGVPQSWGLAALVVGPLVGLALAGSVKTLVVAVPGALVGVLVAIVATGIDLSSPANLVDPAVAVGGAVGLVVALVVETPVLILLTASWGATLVSVALGAPVLREGASLQSSVFEVFTLSYWVVFALGVLVQVALWYYVRRVLDGDQSIKGVVLRRAGRAVSRR